jgi:predicted RNA-binding protein YlxR (DUF448 family)
MNDALHTPTRMCRVCRVRRPKHELDRWVIRDGELIADPGQLEPGRGYYSCPANCSSQIRNKVGLKRKEKH